MDEDRRPVSGADVVLLGKKYESGQPVFAVTLTAKTDSHGAYRLSPVRPERGFVLLASKPVTLLDSGKQLAADVEKRPKLPLPAYYPNSHYAEGAETIGLSAAEERRGIDIEMALGPAFCVEGSVEVAEGGEKPSAIFHEVFPLAGGRTLQDVTVAADAEGKFRACGLHAGEYAIAGGSHSTVASATIAGRDVQDLRVASRRAVQISGETIWDPAPREKAEEPRISLGFKKVVTPVSGIVGGVFSYGGRVTVPGSFTMQRMPVEDYAVSVDRLPEECYVKEASWAGKSILHSELRLTQEADGGQLRFTIACDGGSMTARVTDRDGNPVSNATLYVIPADVDSPGLLSQVVRESDVAKGWSGKVAALAPGKYLVLACELENDSSEDAISKLWQARSRAKEVEVGAGEAMQATVELANVR